MTGPAVDVEQLQGLADEASEVAEWPWSADFAGTVFDNAGFPIAGDVEDSDAALIVAAVNALPALLAALRDRDDLIRRQDAALTAVRELHVPWYEIDGVRHDNTVEIGCGQFDGCEGTDQLWCAVADEMGGHEVPACNECRCVVDGDLEGYLLWPCPTTAALASPDTTQEDDRG